MNEPQKKRICTFMHFSTSESLPYYVRIYVGELSKFFGKVFVLSNNPNLSNHNYFTGKNIEFVYFENKGYDFGMFYRFITTLILEDLSQLAFVNDSNILLRKLGSVFQKAEDSGADFWGLIDSYEKPWFSSHVNNYHLQSHFIVFNEKAISFLQEFLSLMNLDVLMNEKDKIKVRRMVIDQWEIGLSQFYLKKGLNLKPIFDSQELKTKFRTKKRNIANEHFYQLAAEGYPVLKKKVVLNKTNWLKSRKESWQKTIRDFTDPDWNAQQLIDELNSWRNIQNA